MLRGHLWLATHHTLLLGSRWFSWSQIWQIAHLHLARTICFVRLHIVWRRCFGRRSHFSVVHFAVELKRVQALIAGIAERIIELAANSRATLCMRRTATRNNARNFFLAVTREDATAAVLHRTTATAHFAGAIFVMHSLAALSFKSRRLNHGLDQLTIGFLVGMLDLATLFGAKIGACRDRIAWGHWLVSRTTRRHWNALRQTTAFHALLDLVLTDHISNSIATFCALLGCATLLHHARGLGHRAILHRNWIVANHTAAKLVYLATLLERAVVLHAFTDFICRADVSVNQAVRG